MTLTRRSSLMIALAAAPMFSALLVTEAFAEQKYTPAAFAEATKAGKSVLIDVAAPWCPTCKAQKPVINELTNSPEFKEFVVMEVDFDGQKDALKTFKAQSQSTLIAYKGEKETGRSVGQTTKEQIASLLKTAK